MITREQQGPLISIVTPSYNQAQYLEQTIRSVLEQDYHRVEYIIIDGGSTDGSVEIIRQHENDLAFWVSEHDRGQAHAINKGMQRATGQVRAYLNSDDYYLPGTLSRVANHFRSKPDTALLHGRCCYVDHDGQQIGTQFASITRYEEILDLWDIWWKRRQFVQPEVFWTKRIAERVGHFREDLHFVMDYDYWTRILRSGGNVASLDTPFTCFRFHGGQKSGRSREVADELLRVVQPLLWDSSDGLLSWDRHIALQGKWLFDSLFRRQADHFVEEGRPRVERWARLITLCMLHPQIFSCRRFWERLRVVPRHP